MKVLVTGARGFIGRRLVEKLAVSNEVYGLVRPGEPTETKHGVVLIEVDLADDWTRDALPRDIDVVIHLAQSRWFRQFPERAADVFAVNLASTFRLLDYARQVNAEKFVFASSGGVYGCSSEILNEGDFVQPPDFYLRSKYAGELLVESYREYLTTIVLRPFFLYGAGQRSNMLIARLAHCIVEGTAIRLDGPEGIRLNPIHVSDAIDAFATASELVDHTLINVAGDEVLSLRQISMSMARHLSTEPKFEIGAEAVASNMVAGIDRMKESLISPQVQFVDGVEEVCREAAAARHEHK